LWFSSVPPGKCWYSALKLGHDRSFYIPSNSSITCHPFFRRYVVCHWKSVFK